MEGTLARIADRVTRTPQATALRTPAGSWTYQQLWDDAGRIAASLRTSAGVRPGGLVAVQLPSGPDAVAAMLGVWRAGAAFLPIDVTTPAERRAYLLTHSGATVLIGTAGAGDTAVPPHGIPVLTLDGCRRDGAGQSAPALAEPGPAYVIYTSGSTGTPKGVLVEHPALGGHVDAVVDSFGLTDRDTVLQFASIGFDVAQEEIWPTLAAGGTLAFQAGFHASGLLDAALLAELVAGLGVTMLQLPTAYWRMLCAELETRPDIRFPSVRLVVIGGENATLRDAEVHRRTSLTGAELANGYGPTETVITATLHQIPPDGPLGSRTGSLPIGVALGDRQLHVLDQDLRPVGPGGQGELWIGGNLLASGYLHDPGRTEERFRPDPFAERPGARMYRTGDLVLVRSDGALEFLGRVDNQVKVRGYRIELDEVDRHLRDLDGVLDAVSFVLDTGDDTTAGGAKQLAAAVVTAPGGPTPAGVQERLAASVPGYLVPSRVLALDELPMTTSGKVDRNAARDLAERLHARPSAPDQRGKAEPAPLPAADDDPVAIVTLLIARLLQTPHAGPADDFFLLGGDSLVAMRVTALARQAGVPLRPADLLRGRTARAAVTLAGTRERAVPPTDGPGQERVSGAPGQERHTGVVGLLPAQCRWLHDGPLPERDHFNLNAVFSVPAGLGRETITAVARTLLERHPALRSALRDGDDMVDIRPVDAEAAVACHRLAKVPEAELTDRIEDLLAGAQRTLSLPEGRVFQLLHVDLGDAPGRLLMTVHHFVLDGVAMGLLVDELEAALDLHLGRPCDRLAPTATVFGLHTAVSAWVTSDQARSDFARWTTELASPWEALTPTRQSGPALLPSLRTHRFRLSPQLTHRIMHELPALGLPAHDFALGCLVGGLAQWSGEAAHAVDVYAHSRDTSIGDLDVSNTVGYLQSTFPAVLRWHGDGLENLRHTLAVLDRLPARRYGFDALRYGSPHAGERAALSALPRPQVRLNFRGHILRLEQRRPGSVLTSAQESFGAHRSPTQTERYLVMAEADIVGDRLEMGLRYSIDHWHAHDMESLGAAIEERMHLAVPALGPATIGAA
ncbi:amino acid adenylation domain-containing protein [Streptomyces sp. NPDC001393]